LDKKEFNYVDMFEKNYVGKFFSPNKRPGPSFYLCRLVASGRIPSVDSDEAIKILERDSMVSKEES